VERMEEKKMKGEGEWERRARKEGKEGREIGTGMAIKAGPDRILEFSLPKLTESPYCCVPVCLILQSDGLC